MLLIGMDRNKTTLERAFQLAEFGQYENVTRAWLKSEGYNWRQLKGRTLSRQLFHLIQKTRANANRT